MNQQREKHHIKIKRNQKSPNVNHFTMMKVKMKHTDFEQMNEVDAMTKEQFGQYKTKYQHNGKLKFNHHKVIYWYLIYHQLLKVI